MLRAVVEMPDARGYFGLRLIHNNVVSSGNGRDWISLGDPGYRNGRLTPRPKEEERSCVHIPAVKTNRAKLPLRQAALMKSTGSLPTFDGSKGASYKLRPEVLKRWEKTAAAKCIVQPGPRRSPSVPDFIAKRAPLPGDPDAERELAAYQKSLEAHLFKQPTFPVPKYRTFSQPEPHNGFDGRGETFVEPEVKPPTLPPAPVEKYRQFSCPMQQYSINFMPEDPEHGLVESRKSFDFGRRYDS